MLAYYRQMIGASWRGAIEQSGVPAIVCLEAFIAIIGKLDQ